MKSNIKTPIVILLILVALIIGAYWGASVTLRKTQNNDPVLSRFSGQSSEKLEVLWNIISNNYVDNIENDTLTDRVYSSILSALDPHSVYLSPKKLTAEIESLRGNFEGVGIVLRIINDTVRVAQVIPEGPAEKAGVEAGDYILTVDGEPVSGVKMKNDDVVKKLRGPRKSIADIKIKRQTEDGTRFVKIVRDIIETPSLSYSGMVDSQTGYIRLTRFGESTHKEFCQAVKNLKKEGMKRMILDLRDNGGGLLSAAIQICDELLPGKELIVYTQGAHQRRAEEHSHKGGLFDKGEIIIMINEYSASASEIVSGAIQDNDRGLIAGRRSFGKGLVQQQFALPDQSAILLTIARYYTPSGRCIQRPYDKGNDEYYKSFIQQILDGYENDSLIMKITDTTPYHTTKGRTVYGGGGIYPDHIISYKSDSNVVYYNQLVTKGIINEYVFNFVSKHGREIKKQHPKASNFIKDYTVSNTTLEEVFRLGESKGIAKNAQSIKKYKKEILSRIKAEIGEMLYNTESFYAIMLWADPEVQEVLKLFHK